MDTEFAYEEYSKCPDGAPNIVYILLDDMGFAALHCYGSTINTPNIDRLAEEGLRYNNFHTTAVCSATRCSLLTGANHHAAGIASLVDWKNNTPNGIGHISAEYATIAEILKEYDYSTFACGKWHLTDQYSEAGPYDTWPLGKGFERYYGFLNPGTDQYNPALVMDNSYIPQPKSAKDGYHVSEDITDKAIEYIYNQKNSYPKKPFFLYLAYGATHAPHHAPEEYIQPYKGKFDEGWDEIRKSWFENQKKNGIIPQDAELTDRAPYVDAWDSLTESQKKVFARQMEVYAGFLTHTDAQIGRLIDYLESIHQLDNTVVVFLSDNGASSEGGKEGRFNTYKGGEITSLTGEAEYAKDKLELLGTAESAPHYPTGWANACNTPFQWYKIWAHEGGVKDSLIIRYPKLIKDPGTVRSQYHHVSDLTPTMLDIIGVKKPEFIKGVHQKPFTGISLKYTFADSAAESRKHVQYYEVLGNRGIYKDGWKAVVNHTFSETYADDVWELYHVAEDYSEKYDVAAQNPDKLKELIEEFFLEAGRNNIFPMMKGAPHASRENWWKIKGKQVFPERSIRLNNMFRTYRLSGDSLIPFDSTSYSFSADLELKPGDEGVLLSNGGRFGGFSFYIQKKHLVFYYNNNDFEDGVRIESDVEVPEGKVSVKYIFERNGLDDADVKLFVNNQLAGQGHISKFYYLSGGVAPALRADLQTAVSPDYEAPFEYTGVMKEAVLHSYATESTAQENLEKLLREE